MKKRRNEINYIRNKSGWNSNSQTSEKRSSSRASSRLEGKLEIEDGNPDRFVYHTFVQFRSIWKFHIVKKTINRVLIRIFRLPGPRGQASLISCCQLLASRLASATSGGSPTSVTRCEPYLYQCCPHWTCCYPVFNFFRTEAAPSSSRTSWCSPSSASPPSSSSSRLTTIQISKPTYHPPFIRIVILTTFYQIDLIDEIEQVRRYLLLLILIDQIGQYSAMGPAVVYKHISPVFKVFNHFQLDY